MLAQFRAWLAAERGLSAATVQGYAKQARKFLDHLPRPLDAALRQRDAGQLERRHCPVPPALRPLGLGALFLVDRMTGAG